MDADDLERIAEMVAEKVAANLLNIELQLDNVAGDLQDIDSKLDAI